MLNPAGYYYYAISDVGVSPALHVVSYTVYWKHNFNIMLFPDYNQSYSDHSNTLRTAVSGILRRLVYYSRSLSFSMPTLCFQMWFF